MRILFMESSHMLISPAFVTNANMQGIATVAQIDIQAAINRQDHVSFGLL
jgi:protein-arginine kinase